MPPKDSTTADLLRIEKSVSHNASGVERLAEIFLNVSLEMSDLKKVSSDLATSVALLNQGMQVLLADRAQSSKHGGPSAGIESFVAADARNGGLAVPDTQPIPPPSPRIPDLYSPRHTQQQRFPPQQNLQTPPYKLPKVDFPTFNGSGVQAWLQKVQRFFLVHPFPMEQRVLYASLSFQGKAEAWYMTDAAYFERMPWNEFTILLNTRFSEEICENVVGEFCKLTQTGSVQDYQEKFEDLRPLMLQQNPGLAERFFVDSFLSGLKPEIGNSVQMFYPHNMQGVIQLARLQEANLDSVSKVSHNFKSKPAGMSTVFPNKYSSHTSNIPKTIVYPGATNLSGQKDNTIKIPVHKLSQSEMQARREKGLCYTCDEPYSFSHKCKQRQIYMLAGEFEEDLVLLDTDGDPVQSNNATPVTPQDQEVEISLMAISGNVSYQTILLKGKVKNKSITMLVDSGITHNFLDVKIAKMLGCECTSTTTHSVIVAGGGNLQCNSICSPFSWEVNNVKFSSDVRLKPLGGCDLVLGVQWFKSIGSVTMDFSKLQLKFKYQDQDVFSKASNHHHNCPLCL